MKRTVKAVALPVAWVLAMMALPVSASAAEWHSEASETVISGSQVGEDVWTFNAGTVKCKEATYSGTQSTATSTAVRTVPKYSGCTAFGFVNTTVDVNGCELVFRPSPSLQYHLDCWPFTPMVITGFNCWVTIGDQEFASGITHTNTNSGKPRDVDTNINLGGLSYTQHSKSFPGCTNGVFGNGKLTGSATVKGSNKSGEQVGIWIL
jgi:hypothetical protein